MPTRIAQPGSRAGRAFTLIELIVVVGIIVLLVGILVVALTGGRDAARDAATRQTVANLSAGVQSFRNDFGFLPPLVKDNNTDKWDNVPPTAVFDEDSPILNDGSAMARLEPETFRFSTAPDNATDRDYLRLSGVSGAGWETEADFRFSEYSLAYYLVGALPEAVDGVEGPGFGVVSRNGGFTASGQKYAPYYDVANQSDAVGVYVGAGLTVQESAQEGRFELRDQNGVAIRYYRWLRGDPAGDPSLQPAFRQPTATVVNDPEDLRIPFVVAGSSFQFDGTDVTYGTNAQLQGAEWAIVASGADGAFGDIGTEGGERIVNASGTSVDPAVTADVVSRAVPAVQRDNVVELGR